MEPPAQRPELSPIRSRVLGGTVYLRKEDVLAYLRDTANGWRARSSSEVTIVSADCVRAIADELAKVGPR
jgi:hypothetical protein